MLIGGEGHGKTIWLKGANSVKYPCKGSLNYLGYDPGDFILDDKRYRLGVFNPTDDELAQIPKLINELKLEAI